MRLRCAVLTLAALSIGLADTLTLRDGRTVQGSYLGGTSRLIRMAVGERIETFDVRDVSSLQFEGAAAPAPDAEPAEQRRILRPEPAGPPPATTVTSVTSEIPAGTSLTIRMIDDVDSTVHKVGQTFRASVDEPLVIGDRTVIPRGADAVTKLIELKDPNKLTGGGELTLDLVSVVVDGNPVSVITQGVATAGQSRTGQTAKVVGGTAALGAIIGAIAGGGRGAAIGAGAGAGAGTAIQVLTKGTRVRVPSETRLTFTLEQRIPL
jgi:hypothetical protein